MADDPDRGAAAAPPVAQTLPPLAQCAELTAVRHGESVANAAFLAAAAAGVRDARVRGPDAEVPLTELGRRQSAALGRWLATLPAGRRPEVVLCSPYLRARQTWELAVAAAGPGVLPDPPRLEPRLRDREGGRFSMLTRIQIEERFPAEAARRRAVGDLAYRPPGGESFGDVADRLAAVLAGLRGEHAGRRVLVVAHDAVVLMLRYLLEELSWDEVAAITRMGLAANASVTRWSMMDGRWHLAEYNRTDHLRGVA